MQYVPLILLMKHLFFKVPQFIDQLTITDIDLGHTMPAVGHVSVPYLDNRGLWIDMNISYSGAFSITMETKCNLMKASLSKKEDSSESPIHEKRLELLSDVVSHCQMTLWSFF